MKADLICSIVIPILTFVANFIFTACVYAVARKNRVASNFACLQEDLISLKEAKEENIVNKWNIIITKADFIQDTKTFKVKKSNKYNKNAVRILFSKIDEAILVTPTRNRES